MLTGLTTDGRARRGARDNHNGCPGPRRLDQQRDHAEARGHLPLVVAEETSNGTAGAGAEHHAGGDAQNQVTWDHRAGH